MQNKKHPQKHFTLETMNSLLIDRRIVVCIGAGGVGKTTIAASLAINAAKQGKNVVCLTIDPAKRLADSIGIDIDGNSGKLNDITKHLGTIKSGGKLSIGVLIPKETFDQFVKEKASSEEKAKLILENKLYRYLSSSLSGMQEYMALEKLCQIRDDKNVDLIVIDTPPIANAIEFFTASNRILKGFDGSIVAAMKLAYEKSEKLKIDLIGRWTGGILNILSKVTEAKLLSEMMGFTSALSDLFDSFINRSKTATDVLHGKEVLICMITTAQKATLRESLQFKNQLVTHGFSVEALVFNRTHMPKIEQMPPDKLSQKERNTIDENNFKWNKINEKEAKLIEQVLELNIDKKHVAKVNIDKEWKDLRSVFVIPVLLNNVLKDDVLQDDVHKRAQKIEHLNRISEYLH